MKDAKGLFLMLGGVALFILVLGLVTKTNNGEETILSPYLHLRPLNSTPTPAPTGLNNLQPLVIGKTKVMVEVANTNALRSKGLGGITNLPADQGMLFVFESKNLSPKDARFWMKDMQIPLDFVWIRDNRVVEITANVPAPTPNTQDKDLIIYEPGQNIDYVLEVNAGFSMRNTIKVGDSVSL